MRNTEERIKAALYGAKKIKGRGQLRAIAATATTLSIGLIILLSYLTVSMMENTMVCTTTTGFYASIFASPQVLGYMAIGILSFVLGVCITLLCVLLHKKQQEEERDDP